ncbi:hypothetical protein YSY22_05960 [Brevibacillus formosus]
MERKAVLDRAVADTLTIRKWRTLTAEAKTYGMHAIVAKSIITRKDRENVYITFSLRLNTR